MQLAPKHVHHTMTVAVRDFMTHQISVFEQQSCQMRGRKKHLKSRQCRQTYWTTHNGSRAFDRSWLELNLIKLPHSFTHSFTDRLPARLGVPLLSGILYFVENQGKFNCRWNLFRRATQQTSAISVGKVTRDGSQSMFYQLV